MPFDESAYRRVSCTSDTPIHRLSQQQKSTLRFSLRDEAGNTVDLTGFIESHPVGDYVARYEIVYIGSSSSSSSVAVMQSSSAFAQELQVRMAVSQCLNSSANEFEIDGEILDAETGEVQFSLSPENTARPGIFVASVGVFYNDVLVYQMMHYLEFMPTNFSLTTGGPISVPEVRMHMMDMCPDANYLLDELEFTDAEIIHAMRYVVDYFNEINPPIGGYTYDSFPFRANWLDGAAAQLLTMIAHRYRRNTLRYSAGGVTVADQERAEAYERAASEAKTRFKEWAQDKKVALNIAAAYGSIGPTPYGRGYFGGGGVL